MSAVTVAACEHLVDFYESDADLAERAGGYLIDGARAGAVGVVIATAPHRAAFEARVRDEGTLVSLDAASTLARLMRDGRVDRDAFFGVVGSVVRAAAAGGRPVRAYGEMVALLWEAGDVLGAIELETLWNELAAEVPFSLYCAYRSESVRGHEHAGALERVCHLHSAVVPAPPVEAEWRFAADRDAPGYARHLLTTALLRAGHDGELLADAQLVLSELAANAVVHARSPFTVSLRTDASTVRIHVRDHSEAELAFREHPSLGLSGRGLHLVAALARRWGVDRLPDGKVVWAELGGERA